MIISLVHMPADGLRFEHQYRAGELETGDFSFEIHHPVQVSGRVDRVGPDMRLRGGIKASISTACDRCLKEVTTSIDSPFDLLYTPEDPGGAGEFELQTRDLDFDLYKNDEINLDELVLEQLELSLPSRILCQQDCLGLCPQCGINLNVEKCDCRQQLDPRWQALADWKAKSEKE